MTRVFGIKIAKCSNVKPSDLLKMTEKEKTRLIVEYVDDYEIYSLDKWYYYLNCGAIDTNKYYWVVANI